MPLLMIRHLLSLFVLSHGIPKIFSSSPPLSLHLFLKYIKIEKASYQLYNSIFLLSHDVFKRKISQI